MDWLHIKSRYDNLLETVRIFEQKKFKFPNGFGLVGILFNTIGVINIKLRVGFYMGGVIHVLVSSVEKWNQPNGFFLGIKVGKNGPNSRDYGHW